MLDICIIPREEKWKLVRSSVEGMTSTGDDIQQSLSISYLKAMRHEHEKLYADCQETFQMVQWTEL